MDFLAAETLSFPFLSAFVNQGGVLSKTRDGCIYCIPASGTQILRIPTHPDTLNSSADNEVVQLLGDLPVHKDKFQVNICCYFL